MARGTVKEWNDDLGWGVLTSPDVPGEVWAHFVHIEPVTGFRRLDPGDAVEFDYIAPPGGQDGFEFRTTHLRRLSGGER